MDTSTVEPQRVSTTHTRDGEQATKKMRALLVAICLDQKSESIMDAAWATQVRASCVLHEWPKMKTPGK